MKHFTRVEDRQGVARLAEALTEARWAALATEDNAIHAYRGRICVIQLNVQGALFAVDALALDAVPRALRPLEVLLADGARRLYVHGGEYSVAGLKRDYNLRLEGIWDTQQAASLLGLPRTGYRQLVAEHLGVELRLPASAEINWARRPLSDDLWDYAIADVSHLPALAGILEPLIRSADLADELDIANREVAWTPAAVGRFEPARFHKLKGAHRLDARSLRVLRAVYLWREAKAREFDRPPGRLIPNPSLVLLARDPPRALEGLSKIRFHSQLLHDDRLELLALIESALASSEALPDRVVRPPRPADVSARVQRLKVWRRQEAERRGVSLQAVLPKKSLEWLGRHGGAPFELSAVPMLGDSRARRYGETLVELCLTRP